MFVTVTPEFMLGWTAICMGLGAIVTLYFFGKAKKKKAG